MGLTKTGPEGVRVVRLTFYDASLGAPSEDSLLCERLLAADESDVPFYIPAGRNALLNIQVQAFGAPAAPGDATPLVASGFLVNVPFSNPKAGPRVFLPMAGRMGCAPAALNQPRAFHTATALPGGYALIAGGVVTPSEQNIVSVESGLRLTDSVEIYDSKTAQFLSLGPAAYRRAFHAAFLLPGADASHADVLLVGGVGQGALSDGDKVIALKEGPLQPFRLSPVPEAASPPAEILHVDLTTSPPTLTGDTATPADWPARLFAAQSTYSQAWPLVAGGIDSIGTDGSLSPAPAVDLGFDDGRHHPQVGSMAVGRAAFTVTALDPASALAWGGDFNQPDPTAAIADLLRISPAPPSATPLAYDPVGSTLPAPIATAFHTATGLPDGSILLAGGFEIDGGFADDPPAGPGLARVEIDGSSFRLQAVDASQFEPVGYHAAVSLPDGSVLITGGAPATSRAPETCPGTTKPGFCALHQAARFVPGPPGGAGSLESLPEPGLVVARMGHRMVRLDWGLVLITGGLRWAMEETPNGPEERLFVEASAEVYNPADGSPESDAPLGRLPGALFDPANQCPGSQD